MKNLDSFKSKALNQKAGRRIKGGLRFETRDYVEFMNNVTRIASEGNHLCWAQHDGVYCIEW